MARRDSRRGWRLLLYPALLCAAASASPALSQPEASRESSLARQFVDAVTVQKEGQAARFHEPVCPLSYGLPADYNQMVALRLREVALAADIWVDPREDCTPNLIVMVADDSDAVVEVLRRTRPDIFVGLDTAEIRRAAEAAGPVRSWQSSVARRAEADYVPERRLEYLDSDVHLWHGVPASPLRETVRRELRLSVVLFSLDAIDGLSLMQIADHAAMRGLAPTRTAAIASGRSILGLFEEGAGSQGRLGAATNWDQAFLRALYRDSGATGGNLQRAALARQLERALGEGDTVRTH